MRKDAQANRQRLLEAASRVMRDAGGDVPLEVIAEMAGVTRGTVYRNFEDRYALYIAVLEHELALLTVELERRRDEPLAFIRCLAGMMGIYDKYLSVLPGLPDYDPGDGSVEKIVRAIDPALAQAKARGMLHSGLTGYDVVVACRMLSSDWRLDMQPSQEAAFEHRLGLLLHGLGAGRGSSASQEDIDRPEPAPGQAPGAGRKVRRASARS